MPAERITSAANPLVKRVRRLLTDRRFRDREGAFAVEGAQPTGRALESDWDVEVVLLSRELLGATAAVFDELARTARVVDVAPDVFERISDRDGPAGVAAIVRRRTFGPEALRGDGIAVALYEPANPGNVGSIVRTADAVGAAAVVLVGNAVDPYGPAVVKASMGSVFAVPVVRLPDLDATVAAARDSDRAVVAVTGAAGAEHWSTRYPRRPLLLFGSERHGLPGGVAADVSVRIPMVGTSESLNLAAAAAIMLYEAGRP